MFGFLNVYKPAGMTSHDVVAVLRRVTGIRQIGHTGTLDPFAEGVLPICIGKATRLIEYLKDNKAYIGTIQLGKSTNTYDIEGCEVNISDKKVSLEEIKKVLVDFQGNIKQKPPMYSAIKIKGKKLYEYARKNEDIEIPEREITISKTEIVNYKPDLRQLELYIACSKGTYIRSIANDLGEKLGCFGHLIKLIRVSAGDFELKDAVNIEALKTTKDVEKKLIYPLQYLDYPKYELNDQEVKSVSNGMPLKAELENGIILLTKNNELVAVAEALNGTLKCKKVFI